MRALIAVWAVSRKKCKASPRVFLAVLASLRETCLTETMINAKKRKKPLVILPDYSRCVEFFRLHVAMGIKSIPSVPPINYEDMSAVKAIRELPDPEDAAMSARLRREAVPVDRVAVAQRPNEPLRYRGRMVCVYVRDQRDSVVFAGQWRHYAYHLFYCPALQRMKPHVSRPLLATQRTDGLFEVHDLSSEYPRKAIAALGLCLDCREILKERHGYPFNLRAYFETYDVYEMRKLREMEAVPASPDDMTQAYREACAHQCQACGVDCTVDPKLLHLHFEDGDPSHADARNLHILCVDCHAHLPGHDHMKNQPIVQADIAAVHALRARQGIISLNIQA